MDVQMNEFNFDNCEAVVVVVDELGFFTHTVNSYDHTGSCWDGQLT